MEQFVRPFPKFAHPSLNFVTQRKQKMEIYIYPS